MIKPEDILNSYNFARNSDVVYSEIVTRDQFKNLDLQNFKTINKTENLIFYKLTEFKLKENDVIFCNSDMVKNLFSDLKNVKNLKNLKLITNQTDTLITKKIFNLKPNCIKDWYSINVGYKSDNLIPIPLGLSNNYSPKNILVEDINFSGLTSNSKEFLYLNFSKNTNFKERTGIYEKFQEEKWSIVENPNLSLDKYHDSLKNYKFVLCPWGNGIDTHRIWETLYSGNIPVTKQHHTFSTSQDLPIIFVDSYEEITEKKLLEFYYSLEKDKIDFSKLNIHYWLNQIKSKRVNRNDEFLIIENAIQNNYYILEHKIKSKLFSLIKKGKYYFKRIKKLFTFN